MSNIKGTQLTQRDKKLIRTIFEYGLLTSHQIAAWFFVGVQKTTVLRRLRLLQKAKYLRRRGTVNDGTAVFTIGENGSKVMGEKTPFTTFPYHQIEHEVQIGNLRWRLESLGVLKSWMTERALRSEIVRRHNTKDRSKFIVPDAMILFGHFLKPDAKVTLELELHLKSKSRYKEKFRRMDTSPVFTWYVVKNRSMAIKLLDHVREFAPSWTHEMIGITILEELDAHGLDANLYRITDAKKMRDVLLIKEMAAQSTAQVLSSVKVMNREKLVA